DLFDFNVILRGETTGRTFRIAADPSGHPIHEVVGGGPELREEWDFRKPSDGMGETNRHAPNSNGNQYTINIDASTRGLRLSPSVNGALNAAISLTGVPAAASLPTNQTQTGTPVQYGEDTDGSATYT